MTVIERHDFPRLIPSSAVIQLLEFLMHTDALLVKFLLFRCETQLLFDVQPSSQLRNRLDACDDALTILRESRYEAEAREMKSLMNVHSN
jgi:hypothetical protein